MTKRYWSVLLLHKTLSSSCGHFFPLQMPEPKNQDNWVNSVLSTYCPRRSRSCTVWFFFATTSHSLKIFHKKWFRPPQSNIQTTSSSPSVSKDKWEGQINQELKKAVALTVLTYMCMKEQDREQCDRSLRRNHKLCPATLATGGGF